MKRPRQRASSVAVIDIGSNSVRLVVYESMTRSLVSIFNEKTLCGLGREVQTTGLLAPDAVAKALTSLRRFRALCRIMKVGRVHAIAYPSKSCRVRVKRNYPRSALFPAFTSRTASSVTSAAARWN